MKALACWEKADAERVLRTEALQGDRALFAAIHTSLQGIQVDGPLRTSLLEATEQGLLTLLSAVGRPHTFCIVEGVPGAGKSHLIRWLATQWDGMNDELLMVPRADGSLTGTLRRLREQLGPDYESLFAGLADQSRVALAGRANDFQARLANSMREDYYEGTAPVHAEFCSRHKVYDLIGNQRVLEKWSAPRRILEILSGAAGQRDQESAIFVLGDIAELVRAAVGVQLSPAAIMFRNRLSKEETKLRPLLDDDRSDAEIRQELGDAIPYSLKLVEALNARRNDAVRDLLGLGRNAVKDLFRKLRRQLKDRQKRLVLMLEDVTSFEGVDDQLIEAVIQRADVEGNDGLCELVAICGVTPDYFRRMHTLGNVQDRIDVHVRLEGNGNVLATEDDRKRFAARYLRVIRAGVASLSPSHATPNRCRVCPQRSECHREFGAIHLDDDDVGLYPFNARALDALFESLEDVRGRGKRIQTPRSFLKAVLGPTLLEPQHIVGGSFPTAQVETSWHPEHARHRLGAAGGVMGRALEERLKGIEPEERQRVRRLIAWWGDWEQAATIRDEHVNQLAFGAVPRGIFDTFGVAWVGDESGSIVTPKAPVEEPAPETPIMDPEGVVDGAPPSQRVRTRSGPTAKAPSAIRKEKVRAGNVAQRSVELETWLANGPLPQPEFWNQQLLRLVEGLPWGKLEIDGWVRQESFTDALVGLDGTKGGERSNYFLVPREAVIVGGLQAFLSLSTGSDEQPEPNWYSVAACLRRLGQLAQEHAKRVLPDGRSGRWDFRPLLGQALLARAYARGRTGPEVALTEQWEVLWKESDELGDAGRARVDSWQTWLDQTKHAGELPNVFERALGVPRPDGRVDRKPRLLDVSTVAPALARFSRELRFEEGPAHELKSEKFVQLRRLVHWTLSQSLLDDLARRERERLLRLLREIDAVSGQVSMYEHLGRARKALDGALGQAPEFVAGLVPEWQRLRNDLFGASETIATASPDAMWDRVDDLVLKTVDPSESVRIEGLTGSAALTWCLSVRADEVSRAESLLCRLDQLIAKVNLALHELVDTRLGATGNLELDLATMADELTKALSRIEAALGGEHD